VLTWDKFGIQLCISGSAETNGSCSSKNCGEPLTKRAKLQEKINYTDLKDTSDSYSVNLRLHSFNSLG
jgi:hypothetical protein